MIGNNDVSDMRRISRQIIEERHGHLLNPTFTKKYGEFCFYKGEYINVHFHDNRKQEEREEQVAAAMEAACNLGYVRIHF